MTSKHQDHAESQSPSDVADHASIAWALRHCDRAVAQGCSREEILKRSLVDQLGGQSQLRLTSNHFALICINTILMLDDELQGSARSRLPVGFMAMGVRVMLGAERLEDALRHYLRFLRLAAPAYRGKLSLDGETVTLALAIDGDPRLDILPGEETLIAGAHMYMSWYAGRTIPIINATTRCPDHPALEANGAVFFRARTTLGSTTSISFPRACLGWSRRARDHDRPVTQSLRFAMDNIWVPETFALGYRQRANEESYASAICRLLDRIPGLGVNEAAHHLGITPITLWRYLKDEGTSFLRLRRARLVAQAVESLRHSDITVEALASELGFSDARSLRQSIKSLTGHTPSELRTSTASLDDWQNGQELVRQQIIGLGARLDA